jgi:hypothetical protein
LNRIKLNLIIMKQLLLGLIIILMFSSCTRYVVTPGGEGGCGAWHEKKFQGNKAPKQRTKGMPVIW